LDPVGFWNDVAMEVHRLDYAGGPADQPGPTCASRALAMVHVAMYNAWLTSGEPWRGEGAAPVPYPSAPAPSLTADRVAALGSAAATMLVALFPRQRAFVTARTASFAAMRGATPALPALHEGEQHGRQTARRLLAHRAADHAAQAPVYAPGGAPGAHRPDPVGAPVDDVGPHWGEVTRFCPPLEPGGPYAPAPPLLSSEGFAADYEEVLRKGAESGGAWCTRTPDETERGLFWAYDGAMSIGTPPRLYNQCARALFAKLEGEGRGLDALLRLRLLARMHAAMADAAIECWKLKYTYNLWRPVVAIRGWSAGYGGERPLPADPRWRPHGSPLTNVIAGVASTPPFPSYPSGHAALGVAAFEVLRDALAAVEPALVDLPFVVTSDELNGVSLDPTGRTRPHSPRVLTLERAMAECAEAGVWLGVHWRFDGVAGRTLGLRVASEAGWYF